jgi:two-component system NtrC family sensor kinase
VLVNLLTNAIHALAEWTGPRRIRITTRQIADHIQVRVADSGPGIPADILPHIFEPFFTTKQVGCGTGLGLSIAHSIVTEHHGRIWYHPSEDRGAGFTIELPVVHGGPAENGAAVQVEELDEPAAEAAGAPARILVLDDERPLAELLSELLSTLGHEPVTCCSAPQALELLKQQPFDLILSDFRMPLMNGRQFHERVSQHDPALARRVVFLTGDVVAAETREFLQSVGNPHLCKPFRLDAIARVVTRMMQEEFVAA